ncbi:L-ascorbate metabolism protein UlaG (beta-lactamase superfamily) [Anaerotaenia torta]|uniref:MBL fold metallo-hydrolase n=1 Tax=Anaerotaenia torta TaxID=433293 RepID=UPI003D250704
MKMKIEYIGHSGFLMEWKNCYWIFDYYTGTIPVLKPEKRIFVFSSHKHADHFNPEILLLAERYPNVEYILSNDIRLPKEYREQDRILMVKPHTQYQFEDGQGQQILLKALKSTDSGVAFLLSYQGKSVYHAGDLNHWIWKGETKQSNNNMTAMFEREMKELQDISIDVAFAPLDPRQEEWYYLGLQKLLDTARVRYAFPMHFWDKPEIIQQFLHERAMYLNGAEIMMVQEGGQKWDLEEGG